MNIIFNVAGISLLEISIFFLYIGPSETTLFLKYINDFLKLPIKTIDDLLQQLNMNKSEVVKLIYNSDNNEELNKRLERESLYGKQERESENDKLFRTFIAFWCLFCVFGMITYLINNCYKNDCMLEKKYRKNSVDDEELENEINEVNVALTNENKKIKYYAIKVGEYACFSVLVIGFQYVLFEYGVFQYQPLSEEEIKYHMYKYLINN